MRHPTFLPHSIPLHFLGGLALSLCFLPGAVMSGVAGGNVLFPTTTVDELDTPSLAGSGQLSLREALRDAANGDTVILNAAAYSLTRGQLAITQNITVQDGSSTVGRAAISGGNQSRVFHIASGAIVTLDGLVIRDGNGVGSTLSGYGGGILSEGRLTISNSQVRDCNAAVDGGGIHAQATLTIADSTFTANRALAGGGGISTLGGITMTRCEVSHNSAATRGGGLYSQGGTPVVESSSLFNNNAANGGGAYLSNSGQFTNCTLYQNSVTVDGGALYPAQGVTLESCTLSANAAARGGGIHQPSWNIRALELKHNIIHGNMGTPADLSLAQSNVLELTGPNCFGSNAGIETVVPGGKPNSGGQYVDPNFQLTTPGYYAGSPLLTIPPAVKTGSSVLDKGDATTLTKDQRGIQRVVNGAIDLGAAELVHLTRTGVTVANATVDLFPASGLTQSDEPADYLGKPYYTLWYRYTVTPTSDFNNETYSAGLQFFRTGRSSNFLAGNASGAWAYSAEFTSTGSVDLNSTTPESGAPYEFVRQATPRTIIFRVDYRQGADNVTAWLNPDLTKPYGLRTSFEADAAFHALRATHSGGGGGWTFNDITVSEKSPFAATYVLGENETGPVISGPGASNMWYEIRTSQRGVLELSSITGGGGTSHSGQLFDADGRALRANNTGFSAANFAISYDVEPETYYLLAGTNTAAGHAVRSALLPPVVRPPLEIRLLQTTPTFNVVALTWTTVPDSTYELWSSTNLSAWTFQRSFPSTQNTISIIAPPGKNYYRMKKL